MKLFLDRPCWYLLLGLFFFLHLFCLFHILHFFVYYSTHFPQMYKTFLESILELSPNVSFLLPLPLELYATRDAAQGPTDNIGTSRQLAHRLLLIGPEGI